MPIPVAQFAAFDWGAIGVVGGAVYATYQALTNNSIKNAVLELKLAIEGRLAGISQVVAVNFEKHLTLAGAVKDLEEEITKAHKDIAFQAGLIAALRKEKGE